MTASPSGRKTRNRGRVDVRESAVSRLILEPFHKQVERSIARVNRVRPLATFLGGGRCRRLPSESHPAGAERYPPLGRVGKPSRLQAFARSSRNAAKLGRWGPGVAHSQTGNSGSQAKLGLAEMAGRCRRAGLLVLRVLGPAGELAGTAAELVVFGPGAAGGRRFDRAHLLSLVHARLGAGLD